MKAFVPTILAAFVAAAALGAIAAWMYPHDPGNHLGAVPPMNAANPLSSVQLKH